jgi:hypothetical protein
MLHYVLDDDGEPRAEPDVLAWARWFERASKDGSRILAHDRDESGDSDVLVSTVFLGLDHNFSAHGKPVLWETMILGGPLDQYQQRYSSAAAAHAGHREACRLANAARPKKK